MQLGGEEVRELRDDVALGEAGSQLRGSLVPLPSHARSRRQLVSREGIACHWNGVWGFGTKLLTDTVTSFARPATFRPSSEQARPISAIARTSSSVSVGSPTIA